MSARLLIVNPWASGVDEDRLAAVRGALPEGTALHLTTRRGEATDLAREVAGTLDALYVFGGDGTYNEVLNGIDGDTPMSDWTPSSCARSTISAGSRTASDRATSRSRGAAFGCSPATGSRSPRRSR